MKAFVLAAGKSTRLRPLTDSIPKVMIEVANRKILDRNLQLLKSAGIDEVFMNLHYLPEIIQDYLGDGSRVGVRITYSHEPEILGTAGGIAKMKHKLTEPFLVVYGDNVFDTDFGKITGLLPKLQAPILITLFNRFKHPNSGAAGGVVEIEGGYVKAFLEGAQRQDVPYVNAGLYLAHPEIFNYIPESGFSDFGKDVFPRMLTEGAKIQTHILDEDSAVFGVDTPEYLEVTENYFKNKPK